MAEESDKDWKHFCTVLKLDDAAIEALEGYGFKSPDYWYLHGKYCLGSSTTLQEFDQHLFKFNGAGQIKPWNREKLLEAFTWLYEHEDKLVGDRFCNAFTNDYRLQSEERKRKLFHRLDQERPQKKPALETEASRLSASSFTSDSKHLLEGVGTVPPRRHEHLIPSHVRSRFEKLLEAVEPSRIPKINDFFQQRGDGYRLKSRGETTGVRAVQKEFLDGLVKTGVFNKRVTTKRIFNDNIPTVGDRTRTLKDLDLVGGVAASGSPPDGYFHTEEFSGGELGERLVQHLVTGIVECKGSESSALRGVGEAVAHASNVAVTLHKVGLPIDQIVIPIVSLTGTDFQFAAVYLLEPCFPAVCFLTHKLVLETNGNEIARYFCAMLDYTIQLEESIRKTGKLVPRDDVTMELSPEKYYLKKMSDFFTCYSDDPSKEISMNHFLKVTEKLHNSKAVCLPLTIRLGKTKGGVKSEDAIVFDMLAGYQMGFPDDEADRLSLLQAMHTAVDDIHELGVIHMDLYLSNIMWKKLDNGSFDVKLIDFDAAHVLGSSLTTKVYDRLQRDEEELLFLFGFQATEKFDKIYLVMYEKNLNDGQLRVAKNQEELENGTKLKGRLDGRCRKLKKEFIAVLKAKQQVQIVGQ